MTKEEATQIIDKLIAFENFCLGNMPEYKRKISYMVREVEALEIAREALQEVNTCESIGSCPAAC